MRERNLCWDALVEETGANEDFSDGRIAVALKAIRSAAFREGLVDDEAIAEEIHLRAEAYRQHPTFQNCCLTPTALATHWCRVMAPISAAPAATAQQRAFQQARAT